MSYGLSIDGFKKKRLVDIKLELETSFAAALGVDIQTIPQSVLGIMIGIASEREALVWESSEAIYLAMYPTSAEGTSLDNVVAFAGLTRLEGESDSELRARYFISVGALGQNNTDSLLGQLLQLTDVTDAKVFENKTDIVDANGIDPHKFMAVVQNGADADIAQVVWNNTPQGIDSFGDETVIVIDANGDGQNVHFQRPTEVPIYFKINVITDSYFPFDGSDQIKQSIVNYGTANFKINTDVILSRFYTPINLVGGVIDIEIFMGLSASPTGTVNIPIGAIELSTYAVANIEVNVS